MTKKQPAVSRRFDPNHPKDVEAKAFAELPLDSFMLKAGEKIVREAAGQLVHRGAQGLIFNGTVRYHKPIRVYDEVLKRWITATVHLRVSVEAKPW